MKFRSLILGLFGVTALAILAEPSPADLAAQERSMNQAAVIVRLDEEVVESRCVAFEEESISGLDLLSRSGLDVGLRVQGFGSAVCSIEASGCAADDCFCQCAGGDECVYWSYWHQQQDGWKYAIAGASSYRVSRGDVDGWSWGPGSVNDAVEPPSIQFDEICSQQAILSTAEVDPEKTEGPSVLSLAAFSGIALLILAGIVRFRRRGNDH